MRAAQNPVPLDDRQVSAVAARIELDLRLGVVFTRFTTLTLQALGGELAEQRIISYGKGMRYVQPSLSFFNLQQDLVNFLR